MSEQKNGLTCAFFRAKAGLKQVAKTLLPMKADTATPMPALLCDKGNTAVHRRLVVAGRLDFNEGADQAEQLFLSGAGGLQEGIRRVTSFWFNHLLPIYIFGCDAVPPRWCGKNTTAKLSGPKVVYVVVEKKQQKKLSGSSFCQTHCCIMSRRLLLRLHFPVSGCTAGRRYGCVCCLLLRVPGSFFDGRTWTILKFRRPAVTLPRSAMPRA